MMQTKKLRGECQHCGQLIEFEAEAVGTTGNCPYCGQATELMLALPPDAGSPTRTKAIIFTIIVLIILVGGGGGMMMALKRAQRLKAQKQESVAAPVSPAPQKSVDPIAAIGFRASPVTLDKGEGSSIVYAVGTISNLTNRQRFGVRVELELLDAGSNKVGNASDYRATIEPNEEWRFRALVVEKKTASARVVSIKEDK
jgi:hypothetical protein